MKEQLLLITRQSKKIKKKIHGLFEKYLSKNVETFKENYLIKYNREAKEIEIKKYRKELVMKIGIYLYITVLILMFFVWQSISEGGIFG